QEELKGYFDAKSAKAGDAPYQLLADILEKLGRKQNHVLQLEQLQKADPVNQPLSQFLAPQHLEGKELDKAAAVLEALHEKDTSSESYRGLAKIYRLKKQPAELLKLLGQLVEESGGLDALDDEAGAIVEDEALVKALIERANKQLQAS